MVTAGKLISCCFALLDEETPPIGTLEYNFVLDNPVAKIMSSELFRYLMEDSKTHSGFRIPLSQKISGMINHRLEGVRTSLTSFDGATVCGLSFLDEDLAQDLSSFLLQWFEKKSDDTGYIPLSRDILAKVPTIDHEPDPKRPLFILEKTLQVLHFTIPGPPVSLKKGEKDFFLLSYSFHDLLLVATLLYESLCLGKVHVKPNMERMAKLGVTIDSNRLENRASLEGTRSIYDGKAEVAQKEYLEILRFAGRHDLATWRAVTFKTWDRVSPLNDLRRSRQPCELAKHIASSCDDMYDV
jgi:hypothetical protein